MKLTVLEVILLATQVLFIPFIKYVFTQQRNEILNEVLSLKRSLTQQRKDTLNEVLNLLNEHYNGLSDLIDHNRHSIHQLEDNLNHRAELVKIKTKILTSRIDDLENFLGKNCKFQTRCVRFFDDSDSESSEAEID